VRTVFAAGFLILLGVIANFVSVFVLNLAGFPGALSAGRPGKRSKSQFVVGSVLAAIGQSYVYLAFAAFIVSWTRIAADRGDVSGLVLWPIAFLVVVVPVWMTMTRARVEAQEFQHANPQVEALHLTMLVVLVGFFVFTFGPAVVRAGWGWVPYVR
jgi:hypothetical protein